MKTSGTKQIHKPIQKAVNFKRRNWIIAGALILVAAAIYSFYTLTASPAGSNPGPLAFFCSAVPKDIAAEQIDPLKMGEYDYTLTHGSCRPFAAYVTETGAANGLSQDETVKQVCEAVQEALISSLISVQKFDDIQYIVTGNSQNLRAYNMDVYTANCDAP